MMERTFRTVQEIMVHYFPKQIEKERVEELRENPPELGRYIAKKLLDQFRSDLNLI